MSFLSKLFGNTKAISPTQAHQMMESHSDVIVLDVRTRGEYQAGRINNALLIPVDELAARAEKSLRDKQAKILVYCQSGARAGRAVQILTNMGYSDVVSFGGIGSWPYEIIRG